MVTGHCVRAMAVTESEAQLSQGKEFFVVVTQSGGHRRTFVKEFFEALPKEIRQNISMFLEGI